MEDAEGRVLYFGFCGEANTEKLLQAVRRRCGETPIGRVVIASETGRSALRALELLAVAGVDAAGGSFLYPSHEHSPADFLSEAVPLYKNNESRSPGAPSLLSALRLDSVSALKDISGRPSY